MSDERRTLLLTGTAKLSSPCDYRLVIVTAGKSDKFQLYYGYGSKAESLNT
jgi:hypothetical protein